MPRFLVTTQLAKQNFLPAAELFDWLHGLGWMRKGRDGKWVLTEKGNAVGGKLIKTEHGEVPAWPESVLRRADFIERSWKWFKTHTLDAKDLAKSFGGDVESWEVNEVLGLGGLILAVPPQGWAPTPEGYERGGFSACKPAYESSPHVRWKRAILDDETFLEKIKTGLGQKAFPRVLVETKPPQRAAKKSSAASPCECRFRTDDGHYVRSKAEVLIDNWLYAHGLAHAYEPPLPGGKYIGDFLVPTPKGGIYIEFWGLAGDGTYDRKRLKKTEVYRSSNLRLMDLDESDMASLDASLKERFAKFGLSFY
jgi:hypothetical protein